MRHDRRRQRSPGRSLWALLQIVGHVLAPWRRRWRLRWGARPGEPAPSWPGEDLIPNPDWGYTHAVTIAASPEEVWPWVAQIGQARGGFYSFELLENVFTTVNLLAHERRLATRVLALPLLGTGIQELDAARIADSILPAALRELEDSATLDRIVFGEVAPGRAAVLGHTIARAREHWPNAR